MTWFSKKKTKRQSARNLAVITRVVSQRNCTTIQHCQGLLFYFCLLWRLLFCHRFHRHSTRFNSYVCFGGVCCGRLATELHWTHRSVSEADAKSFCRFLCMIFRSPKRQVLTHTRTQHKWDWEWSPFSFPSPIVTLEGLAELLVVAARRFSLLVTGAALPNHYQPQWLEASEQAAHMRIASVSASLWLFNMYFCYFYSNTQPLLLSWTAKKS